VEIDGKVKKSLHSGDGFGELALLYSSPRSASIKAIKASFLWYIDRTTFRRSISSLI
jgi:CRP-like cAMP-binding protein